MQYTVGQCGNRGNVNFVLTEAQTVLKWSTLFLHLSEKDFDFACEQAVIIEISNQSYNNIMLEPRIAEAPPPD